MTGATVHIEITEEKLRELVTDWLRSQMSRVEWNEKKVVIQVKSKQNYKSEWESAAFRAVYDGSL